MPFSSIYDLYTRQYGLFIDSFTNCSIDVTCGYSVVRDSRDCFNFDKIRNFDYCIFNLKTSDSLFFACDSQRIAFVEFKNTRTKGKLREIAQKAADSLFIHCDICKKNGVNPDYVSIHYFAVFSYSKNPSLSNANTRITVILQRSGKHSQSLFVLATTLNSFYLDELCTRYPSLTNIIDGFEVVLSDSFTSRINQFEL